MVHNIIDFEFDDLVGLDKNPNFVAAAKNSIEDSRVRFIEEDLCIMDSVAHASVDAALSVFVINEIADIKVFFHNVARILSSQGCLFLVCTHPFTALIDKKRNDWGVEKSKKITGISNYFVSSRGKYHFTLSKDFADYYHYNFEHIVNSASGAGLFISYAKELTTDAEAFAKIEEYRSTRDLPKYLYLEFRK